MSTIQFLILLIIVILSLSTVMTAHYCHTYLFKNNNKIHFDCDLTFEEFDIKGINGRFYNNFPGRRVLFVCHGNNDNITERKYLIDLCQEYKLNLLLFDYQGFGKSSGTPYQYSLQPDSQTAYDFLISKKVNPKDVIIWGESLGGNPATYLAETNECGLLVLVSTFSSMEDTFKDYDHYFYNYSGKVLKQLFDNSDTLTRIKNVKVPVIIIHSTEDELIPYKAATRLFDTVSHKGKLLISITGTHGNPSIDTKSLKRLMAYLTESKFSSDAPIVIKKT